MWSIIVWWAILEGIGVVAFPFCFGLFSREAGHGYAFGKVFALLLLTYVSWLGGYVVPMPLALGGTLAAMVCGGLVAGWAQRAAILDWLRTGGWRPDRE